MYNVLKKQHQTDQVQFLSKLREFNQKTVHLNTVWVDIENIFYKEYPFLKNQSISDNSLDKVYNNNYDLLRSELKLDRKDVDYYIENHDEFNSLLYFCVPSNFKSKICEFIKLHEENDESKYTKENNDLETTTKITTLKRIEPINSQNHFNGAREKSEKAYEKQNKNNERTGREAEEIAYNELMKDNKVIWHSKYSKNPADRNNLPPDNIVCDMWVSGKKNKYFEVKSSLKEFELTISEYESMKRHKEEYEIVLVNINEKSISRHSYDELNEFKEINSYIYKFKQIENK